MGVSLLFLIIIINYVFLLDLPNVYEEDEWTNRQDLNNAKD